jgi:hypothetical protein
MLAARNRGGPGERRGLPVQWLAAEQPSDGLLLIVSVEVSHFVNPLANVLVGVKTTLQ